MNPLLGAFLVTSEGYKYTTPSECLTLKNKYINFNKTLL